MFPMHPLTEWLTHPSPDARVYLADSADGWQVQSYPELAASARRVAAALAAEGVRPGDTVCVLMPTGYPALSAIFGVWTAGATVCPIVPPSFQPADEYIRHVAAIVGQAAPRLTISSAEFVRLIGAALNLSGQPGLPWVLREGGEELSPRPPGELALLQFTSGSTGRPRGVRVSWDNLAANLAMLARWTDWRPGEGIASWLPLHHDMGLIGCLLSSVANQADLWLMRPEQFITNPLRWLECFGPGQASHTASPSFGLAYAARRIPPERLAALDLSGLRTLGVGAETIDASALESFARFAAPAGFSRTAFLPIYGLAENTLGVTCCARLARPRIIRPGWSGLQFGEPVPITEVAQLGHAPIAPGSGWLIGHGRPADGGDVGVRIAGKDGGTLADGYLGEIVVTGASVAGGYHAGRAGDATRFVDGELWTGDGGFFHGGELYVLGRMGDSLKLLGRSVYVEDLDAKAAAAAGIHKGKILVVASTNRGRAAVAVFAEARPGPWRDEVITALREELGREPVITIVCGQRGLIHRTSSGKPRRRHMWQLLQGGALTHTDMQSDGDGIRTSGGTVPATPSSAEVSATNSNWKMERTDLYG
jgi:fatty-acyl-CoA synthase